MFATWNPNKKEKVCQWKESELVKKNNPSTKSEIISHLKGMSMLKLPWKEKRNKEDWLENETSTLLKIISKEQNSG